MLSELSRHRSLFVYHMHMGGPDADAIEWSALLSPRFAPRLQAMGVSYAHSTSAADIIVLTGLLTARNLNAVLAELAHAPTPCVVVAAGSNAINGGDFAKSGSPALAPFPLSHYVDVGITVPGDPPTPHAFIAALAAAANSLARPEERIAPWTDS